jgi:hypothetical protein
MYYYKSKPAAFPGVYLMILAVSLFLYMKPYSDLNACLNSDQHSIGIIKKHKIVRRKSKKLMFLTYDIINININMKYFDTILKV